MIDHEEHATDEQAPDTVMNDTESESEGGEMSTAADMSVPLKEVCIFLYQVLICIRIHRWIMILICTRY